MLPTPYRPDTPPPTESREQLRARIPGWGADLNPKDRPAVPRLQAEPHRNGAHWEVPESQPENWPRERSIEHAVLTPVFGTACPPHGLSGAIRRHAYKKYSEARAAHWLLLIAADRVDSGGSSLRSLATLRPDNPFTETGVRAEFSHHAFASRFGKGRADVKHQPLDPVIVLAPWLARVVVAYLAIKAVTHRLRRA
jgi:hypothetical protein